MAVTERADVFDAIENERTLQAEKWNGRHMWGAGDCSSPDVDETVKVAVLIEEAGEVARAVLTADHEALRNELIQVAAVAVAWLEGMKWETS